MSDVADYDWARYGDALVLFGQQHFPVLALKADKVPLGSLSPLKQAFVDFTNGGGFERGESFVAGLGRFGVST